MINGIICEFNPFHNGHEYLLSKAKENGGKNICVMSGNFVQRGEAAIYEKRRRAEMALKNGADVVISLPVGWSMSGAENFAYGGVSLLKSTGIVDNLAFGCENNNEALLNEAAQVIFSNNFADEIGKYLSLGDTYAVAREKAINALYPHLKEFISEPNNILGVQYLVAAKQLNFSVGFTPIARIGTKHDSDNFSGIFSSASNIRKLIRSKDTEKIKNYLPENVYNMVIDLPCSDLSTIENAILFKLRNLSLDDIRKLPDISEGIENRIFDAIKTATSLDELYSFIKTKRYTMARIRRIIMSAAFSVDNSFIKREPPYIHILGYKKESESLVSQMAQKATKPVLLSSKDYIKLDDFGKKVFETECITTDLYGMSFNPPFPCSKEYTEPIVKI